MHGLHRNAMRDWREQRPDLESLIQVLVFSCPYFKCALCFSQDDKPLCNLFFLKGINALWTENSTAAVTKEALTLQTQAADTTRLQRKLISKQGESEEKSKTEFKIRGEAAVYCDMLPLLVPISHITGMRPKATVASK